MAKHTMQDLKLYQSLPLDVKVEMTKNRIRGWVNEFGESGVYVAISGGKDSQVLAHIVRSMYDSIPLVFVNTGLEYDSVRKKALDLSDEVLRPSMDFVSVITKYGYPVISKTVSHNVSIAQHHPEGKVKARYFSGNIKGSRFDCAKYSWLLDAPFRVSDKCCEVMKKKPSHNYAKINDRKAIIGTMAQESQIRYKNWLQYGCNAFDIGNPTSQPLSFWTEQDVLLYIKENNLDIAEIYGNIGYLDDDGMLYENNYFDNSMSLTTTGVKRTGCVFCMFGIAKDTDRFVKLREVEPAKYDYIMRGGKFDEFGMWVPDKGLGYKFVIEWINEHGNFDIKL